MTKINHIKTLRNHEDVSINEIAQRAQVNWRTAKKYADEEQVPQEKQVIRKGMMYEEHWGEIVTDWLIEDQKLKPKLRRRNKTIFQQLQTHGFTGSYRTVCYFIAEWKEGKGSSDDVKDKNSERLNHPPAEAQVDFGITEAVKDGKFIDVHCLVMSLPYSNAAFTIPLPGENQECFLYGLKKSFELLGGVPRKLRIDNLKAAVIKARNKDGEAIFTDEFLQFANFYRFEIQACNTRKGNEKGHVENKVGYVRYNFVTPSPVIESYEDLTNILSEKLEQDRQRIHY
ncbi:IS21 family transposase [Halobacillus litoralis]|uniref:IS21 family transposase n=1 Tax=Halobacillus litoralis TaxID=45668 RepID=UPI001EFFB637|nr:IS21 family transposase [Halobacillus litoralis]